MTLLRRPVASLLTIALALPGVVRAETSLTTTTASAPKSARIRSTPIMDSAKRQMQTLAAAKGRRNQGAPPPAEVIGATYGLIFGGYAGLYIASRSCHCESDAGALIGSGIGAVAGWWLVRKLTRP